MNQAVNRCNKLTTQFKLLCCNYANHTTEHIAGALSRLRQRSEGAYLFCVITAAVKREYENERSSPIE